MPSPFTPFAGIRLAITLSLITTVLHAEEKPVTVESLLAEMTDHASVARWPSPEFKVLQASSHDRRTVAPDQPGWFANDDHTQFIRTEHNQGRVEQVMMDAAGPGCIVRFWLTTVQNKNGVLRIYLDGSETPALSFPAYDLLSGSLGVGEPLALPHPGYTPTGNGGNTLMLPIPYAAHCKVTWEEQGAGPRYYQINYREYQVGARVETFTTAALSAARPAIKRAGEALLSPPVGEHAAPLALDTTIPPGAEASLDLPAGPAAVRQMSLRLEPGNDLPSPEMLRSLIVRMQFDGKETVWCPAGDFFGSGVGVNELKNWYRSVEKDGTMSCRWVMPYASGARITLTNAGNSKIRCSLKCETGPWKWDERSMHFHSAWHYQANLTTPPQRDWNFIRLRGRGVYVGDTLSLYNKVATWYGEGDEKIRVDGEALPSHLGTGTEDYYNYSFAPRGIMQTPFANQVRVDQEMTQGHNVMTRSRNLDGIPFSKSLDFDLELISWKPTRMIYAATTHWYAFPGGSSNRIPEPANATAAIPTLADAQAPPPAFPGVIDAEQLAVAETSPGLVVETQNMETFGVGAWSRGEQLLVKATKAGDFVKLRIPARDGRPRKLVLAATRAPDFGTLSFTVNGKAAAKGFDGYAPTVTHSGDFEIGTFKPEKGFFDLTIKTDGANPASAGARFYLGIDYLKLVDLP